MSIKYYYHIDLTSLKEELVDIEGSFIIPLRNDMYIVDEDGLFY